MAEFKVVASPIKLFPHPNADALLLGNVGGFQVVVAKSNEYKDGDLVCFAPEKAVLSADLAAHYTNSETGISYLKGSEHNRVGSIKLRGEISEGITISLEWVRAKLGREDIPLDEDLSEALGITKWEAPIPTNFSGVIQRIETDAKFFKHDVERFGIYQDEFELGEPVVITEKLHGSQINILKDAAGQIFITSKGFAPRDLSIVEDETNIYWKAARNSGIIDLLNEDFAGCDIQVLAEVLPCQKGFSYGFDTAKPILQIFRVIFDGQELSYRDLSQSYSLAKLQRFWVPVLYEGPFDPAMLPELAKGPETVSQKQLHIREGIVVSPKEPRRAKAGFQLLLKVLNPKYVESDEAFA